MRRRLNQTLIGARIEREYEFSDKNQSSSLLESVSIDSESSRVLEKSDCMHVALVGLMNVVQYIAPMSSLDSLVNT